MLNGIEKILKIGILSCILYSSVVTMKRAKIIREKYFDN